MEERKNRNAFVLGIFIVAAIGILILVIFTLGGQRNTFSKKFSLHVVFPDINGLKVGNNIWFSGVKVGTVRTIDLKGDSAVDVTLNIEEKYHKFIHQDASARISSDGLLGNKIVILNGGTAPEPVAGSNSQLSVQVTKPEDDMMLLLKNNGKNLLAITGDLKTVSKKIADGEGTLGKLISDPALANQLHDLLGDFKAIGVRSRKVVNDIETFTGRMNTNGSSINQLFSDTSLIDTIRLSIADLRHITGTASAFADKLNVFASDLDQTGKNLRDSANTAGLILNSKTSALEIAAMIRNLESASKKLDEDLEALQHNIFFRGFFRKKAKSGQ